MKVWLDFTNVPHAHFFSVIWNQLYDRHKLFATARDFAELKDILNQKNIEFTMLGSHHHGTIFKKIFGTLKRYCNLWKRIPAFDLSISFGSYETIFFSKTRGKKTIVFDDNDISPNWLYAVFTDYFICPNKFNIDRIIRQGMKKQNIYTYEGYKEDIYIADYSPDPHFLEKIPFKEYLVVRPENLSATYIKRENKKTIAPELLRALSRDKNNIIFLPRYDHEKSYAEGLKNVYVPASPLNGLDLCFHAKAVFTGAGTLAREAACLGIAAVSFFPGNELLSVDKDMISKDWLFHSRNIDDIIKYFTKFKRREFNIKRCKEAQKEVFEILNAILDKIGK